MTQLEYLEEGADIGEYWYYNHTKYPFHIKVTDEYVTITKMFKNHVKKEKNYPINKIGHMTKHQTEEFVLDCVQLFLK